MNPTNFLTLPAQVDVAPAKRQRMRYVRKRNRYADGLRRRIPEFRDLTRAEARVVTRLVDEVVVDGGRVLMFGTREVEALVAAIPRLGPRLRSSRACARGCSGYGLALAEPLTATRSRQRELVR